MRVVDSHCHVSTVWYEPVETLLDQMDRNGVAQAVLIQMLGQLDNCYQQDCMQRYPERFASVVAVDAARADACDALERLAVDGAAGVRLRPEARSPGAEPLAIWRKAASLGLVVSCVGAAETFRSSEFFDLLERLPDMPIVLEHLGGTSRAGSTDLETRRRVFDAARYPNVYLKVPGLGELVPRSAVPRSAVPRAAVPQSAVPCAGVAGSAVLPDERMPLDAPVAELDLALERFGPDRLMWGSDFPLVGSREGYANALGWTRDAIASLRPGAEERVFGGTARAVFKLP